MTDPARHLTLPPLAAARPAKPARTAGGSASSILGAVAKRQYSNIRFMQVPILSRPARACAREAWAPILRFVQEETADGI